MSHPIQSSFSFAPQAQAEPIPSEPRADAFDKALTTSMAPQVEVETGVLAPSKARAARAMVSLSLPQYPADASPPPEQELVQSEVRHQPTQTSDALSSVVGDSQPLRQHNDATEELAQRTSTSVTHADTQPVPPSKLRATRTPEPRRWNIHQDRKTQPHRDAATLETAISQHPAWLDFSQRPELTSPETTPPRTTDASVLARAIEQHPAWSSEPRPEVVRAVPTRTRPVTTTGSATHAAESATATTAPAQHSPNDKVPPPTPPPTTKTPGPTFNKAPPPTQLATAAPAQHSAPDKTPTPLATTETPAPVAAAAAAAATTTVSPTAPVVIITPTNMSSWPVAHMHQAPSENRAPNKSPTSNSPPDAPVALRSGTLPPVNLADDFEGFIPPSSQSMAPDNSARALSPGTVRKTVATAKPSDQAVSLVTDITPNAAVATQPVSTEGNDLRPAVPTSDTVAAPRASTDTEEVQGKLAPTRAHFSFGADEDRISVTVSAVRDQVRVQVRVAATDLAAAIVDGTRELEDAFAKHGLALHELTTQTHDSPESDGSSRSREPATAEATAETSVVNDNNDDSDNEDDNSESNFLSAAPSGIRVIA